MYGDSANAKMVTSQIKTQDLYATSVKEIHVEYVKIMAMISPNAPDVLTSSCISQTTSNACA